MDPCDPNPCFPGVVCVTIWKGRQTMFECGLCPDGMVGDGLNCSFTDPCLSNPCSSDKICTASEENFYKCKPKKSEVICPDVNHCFPGVKCILTNTSVPFITCGSCPIGYIGDGIKCKKIERDPKMIVKVRKSCLIKPCKNGGTCLKTTGKCLCPPGLRGRRCQKTKKIKREYLLQHNYFENTSGRLCF